MNKPITNRVKNAPNSPAKQTSGSIVMANTSQGEGTPDQTVEETVRTKRNLYSSDKEAWDANNDNVQSRYPDYASFHADAEKWRKNNPGYQYKEETVTKTIPGTPGETTRTTYKPEIVKNQTQTTPWENRWADRIADQQVREGRQDARRRLRKIGVEEFKTLRREGAGLRDAFKGMRDIQTGRGNLSDYERDLYETKRGLKDVEEAQAAENAYRTLATRGDNVKTTHDFTTADAGTTEGGTTLKNYETNLGGKPEIEPGNAAEPQNWHSGIDARKQSRAKAALLDQHAENQRTKRLASEAAADIESDIVGKMPKGNDGTIDSKGNPTDKAKSLDDITLNATDTKLESVPEDNADFRPLEKKTSLNRKKPKIDIKVPTLKPKTAKRPAPTAEEAADIAAGIIKNTGTANRSEYNRTSPPLVDGAPTRENRPPMSPANMKFGRNVGMQPKSALKKGYFKNK